MCIKSAFLVTLFHKLNLLVPTLSILSLTLVPFAEARPITYKDGTRLFFEAGPQMREASLAYSISSTTALGIDSIWHTPPEENSILKPEQAVLFRWDQLVHRVNHPSFQASLFSVLGAGYLLGDDHPDRSHLRFGLSADAENRFLHISGMIFRGVSPQLTPIDHFRARAGFSPYEAEFNELHTWIFIQAQKNSIHEASQVQLGPVLRLTYQNFLGELGLQSSSSQTSVLLSFETTL